MIREAYEADEVPEATRLLFAVPRPAEEFYDMGNDPLQLVNLAGDPDHAEALEQHRAILAQWIEDTDDQGQYPESDASLGATLQRWKNRCINPEYDRLRQEE